jgi:hypothetical protein
MVFPCGVSLSPKASSRAVGVVAKTYIVHGLSVMNNMRFEDTIFVWSPGAELMAYGCLFIRCDISAARGGVFEKCVFDDCQLPLNIRRPR